MRSSGASRDDHTFLAAGAVVIVSQISIENAANFGAQVEPATIVSTGASFDHGRNIADGVHRSTGVQLSGTISVGDCPWLGAWSSGRNNVVIG